MRRPKHSLRLLQDLALKCKVCLRCPVATPAVVQCLFRELPLHLLAAEIQPRAVVTRLLADGLNPVPSGQMSIPKPLTKWGLTGPFVGRLSREGKRLNGPGHPPSWGGRGHGPFRSGARCLHCYTLDCPCPMDK